MYTADINFCKDDFKGANFTILSRWCDIYVVWADHTVYMLCLNPFAILRVCDIPDIHDIKVDSDCLSVMRYGVERMYFLNFRDFESRINAHIARQQQAAIDNQSHPGSPSCDTDDSRDLPDNTTDPDLITPAAPPNLTIVKLTPIPSSLIHIPYSLIPLPSLAPPSLSSLPVSLAPRLRLGHMDRLPRGPPRLTLCLQLIFSSFFFSSLL